MKKYMFIALGAMLAVSCSENNEPTLAASGKNIDLSVSNTVVLSRTTTDETNNVIKTSFVAEDQIGVSATGGAQAVNVLYKVSTDGEKLESTTPIATTADAALQAYTPYQEGTTADINFEVKADQTTVENFNGSNFMTANANVSFNNPNASLSFTPRGALVRVEMAGSLGATATAVSLCGMKPGISWTASSDAVQTTGDAVDVKMHKVADKSVFMAFVPAQSSTANTALFAITIGDNEYVYTPSSAIEFKGNTVKRFKLTVNADQSVNIESSVVNGTDWTEEAEISGESEITRRVVELISDAEGNFQGKTLATATGLQGTTEGWNALVAMVNGSPAATIEINGDEAVLTTNDGGWYQRALVFRTPDGKGTPKKYQLKFDVKGGTDFQVAVMRGQTKDILTDNVYFSVAGATKAKTEKSEAEYTTKTLEVDLSLVSPGEVDFSTGVAVLFFASGNTADQKHYFRNVSFKEL